MRKRSFFTPILCLPLLACGGDKNKVTVPDSHLGSGSGSGTPCTADASYGSADFGSAADQYAEFDGSGSNEFEKWEGLLNADDLLELELYPHSGGFAGNITTGTFQITGGDANYQTCGICVRMLTDTTMTNYADDYLASAGTVTLTQVSGSNFAGTISNITMDHVTIGSAADNYVSTVVGDCTSKVTSGTLTSTLVDGSAGSAAIIARVHWDRPTLARRHR